MPLTQFVCHMFTYSGEQKSTSTINTDSGHTEDKNTCMQIAEILPRAETENIGESQSK